MPLGIQSYFSPKTSPPMAQPTQQYGLSGAENALAAGAQGGLSQIGRTGIDVNNILSGGYQNANQQLSPYASSGVQANYLQAALSGAMGNQAQSQAMSNYQTSPFYDEARAQAEKAITQNAAAGGNLASGNTLDQLYQNASGMFLNDYNNRFSQLGQVSDRGYNASIGLAGIVSDLSRQGASIRSDLGQMAAGIPIGAGSQAADYRMQAGRDIAGATANTTSALANLINQQGSGISDMVGNYSNNIQALMQQATQGDAGAKEQLATILANISTGSASQQAALPTYTPATTNTLEQVGQLTSGIGGMLQQFSQPSAGIQS